MARWTSQKDYSGYSVENELDEGRPEAARMLGAQCNNLGKDNDDLD